MEVKDVSIEKIDYLEENRETRESDLQDLIANIKSRGLLNPVTTKHLPNGRFLLVAGYRRLAACKKLGWTTIPSNIRDDISTTDSRIYNLIENVQRKSITQLELGISIVRLKEERNMTDSEVAAAISISVSTVKNAILIATRVDPSILKNVAYSPPGHTYKKGKMGASIATKIYHIDKKYRIGKENQVKLSELLRKDEYGDGHLNHIAILLKQEVPFRKALELTKRTRIVKANLAVYPEEIDRLTKKYGCSQQILLSAMISGAISERLHVPGLDNLFKKICQTKN